MKNKQNSMITGYCPGQRRIFSKELKRKLVEEIELERLKVRDVANLYKVSDTNVYRWLKNIHQ